MHIRGLDHVALGVRSLPRAAAWYRALLGLEDFRPGDPAFQNEAIRMVQSPCGGAKLALLHLDDAAWALRERQLRAAIGEALRARAAPAGAGPEEARTGGGGRASAAAAQGSALRPPLAPLVQSTGWLGLRAVRGHFSLVVDSRAEFEEFVATLPARLEAGIATHAGACHGASATQPEEAAGLGGGAGRPGLGPAGDLHGAPGGAAAAPIVGTSGAQALRAVGVPSSGSCLRGPGGARESLEASGPMSRHHRACVEQQFTRLFRWREYENYGPEVQQSVFFHDLDLNEVEVTFWGGRTEGFPDAAWSAEAA